MIKLPLRWFIALLVLAGVVSSVLCDAHKVPLLWAMFVGWVFGIGIAYTFRPEDRSQ